MSTVVPRSGFAAVSNRRFRDENPSFSSQSNPAGAQHIQGNFLSTRPFHVASMSTCHMSKDTVSTLQKPPAVLWLTVKDILWIIAGFLSGAAIKLFRFDLIMCACQENLWALQWLWDTLPFTAERLASFSQEVTQEMENTAGLDICGKNTHPIIWLFIAKYYSVISLLQPRVA